MKLYDHRPSGNAYKVRLLLAQLARPYERVELDIERGETRTPEFLRINPNGRIPVLELDDGTHLCESNAILFYLAQGTAFLPEDPRRVAEALQWMFFEQYSHEPFVAVLRFWSFANKLGEHRADELAAKRAGGDAALAVMERHLEANAFFVGSRESLADLALYAYTHVADEGGFELGDYPAIRAWLDRVATSPGHVPMTEVGGLPS